MIINVKTLFFCNEDQELMPVHTGSVDMQLSDQFVKTYVLRLLLLRLIINDTHDLVL